MAKKSNPQLTIPVQLFQELQALADEIGVSSPAQIISLYHRTYKADLLQRLAPNYSPSGVTTPTGTPNYIVAVAATQDTSTAVENQPSPLSAFADMSFD